MRGLFAFCLTNENKSKLKTPKRNERCIHWKEEEYDLDIRNVALQILLLALNNRRSNLCQEFKNVWVKGRDSFLVPTALGKSYLANVPWKT